MPGLLHSHDAGTGRLDEGPSSATDRAASPSEGEFHCMKTYRLSAVALVAAGLLQAASTQAFSASFTGSSGTNPAVEGGPPPPPPPPTSIRP
jgi:hypothetical protein